MDSWQLRHGECLVLTKYACDYQCARQPAVPCDPRGNRHAHMVVVAGLNEWLHMWALGPPYVPRLLQEQ